MPEEKNEYLEMMLDYESRHQAMFEASTSLAADSNPEEEARKRRIANLIGVPVEAVNGSPDMANRMAVQRTILDDTADTPALRKQYTDADFAKLAHDQSANLGLIERTARHFAAGFGGTGVGGTIKGLGDTLHALEQLTGSESILADSLTEIGRTTKDYWRSLAPEGDDSMYGQVVQGLGQIVPQLIGGHFLKGASFIQMFAQGADQMADKIARDKKAQKTDKDLQAWEVLSGGFITGATEMVTNKLLLKPPQVLALKNMWLHRAANVGLGAAGEGVQELSENIAQDLAHISLTNPDSKVAFGEALEAGDVGSMVGAITSAVIQGALHIRTRGMQQTLTELSDATKLQELRERDPATYQTFADNLAAHLAGTIDGAVENLYVDANTFHQVMIDAKLDPAAVVNAVPSLAGQLEEAMATGGDIVIPLNDFIGKVAGTDIGDMLTPHVRSTPEAPSMAEVEAAAKISQDLQAQADELLAKQGRTADFVNSANQVQKAVFDQLNATGTYAAPVSRAYSSFVRDFYVTTAAKMGISPTELYQAHPYHITSGELGQGQMTQGQTAIESPEFQSWFGESKAIDEGGKPLRAYHGTAKYFEAFDTTISKENRNSPSWSGDVGTWFAAPSKYPGNYDEGNAEAVAETFTEKPGGSWDEYKDGARVVPVYLSIKNPMEFEGWEHFDDVRRDEYRGLSGRQFRDKLVEQGYDGMVIRNSMTDGNVDRDDWVAFFPNQIKSATANRGTYDPNDPNILHQADDGDKHWRNWEPEITSTGKIKGAPEWVNGPTDLKSLRQLLRKFLKEGAAGRMWYEDSADAIMRMTDYDVVKAEKFVQLLAIYSPNSNVWVNTIQAVRAYTHWAAGLPAESFSVGSEKGDSKAIDALYHGTDWDGRKTNSFYLNLMHDIVLNYPEATDKLKLDPEFVTKLSLPVTVDVWIGRAFGYDSAAFSDDKGTGKYSFAENEIRRLTARLNSEAPAGEPRWTPHQVQAAIWTAIKTRYELKDVKDKTNRKSLREGVIKIVDGKPVYPKKAKEYRKHLDNWRHFAMQPTSAEVNQMANDTSRSFGDDLARMTEVITWEAIPSTDLPYDIHNASPEAKRAFTAAAKSLIIDEAGNDQLAYMLGVPLSYSALGYGAYAGDVNANVLSHILPAREKESEGFSVKEVRAYCRAIQYIFKQDAVPWFRPDNRVILSEHAAKQQKFRVLNDKGRTVRTFDNQEEAEKFATPKGYAVRGGNLARAFTLQFGKSLDINDLNSVLLHLQEYLGEKAGFTRTAANEVTIVNFRDDETKLPGRYDEDFIELITEFVNDKKVQLGISSYKTIWAEGEYGPEYDWTQGQGAPGILEDLDAGGTEGTEGRGSGSGSGRSDLHAWVRDRRDAFDRLLEEYSGDNLAAIEKQLARTEGVLYQTARVDRGGLQEGRGSTGQLDETKSPQDSVRVTGVHFSKSPREVLSSAFQGTNAAGKEMSRLPADKNSPLYHRIYFYVNTGKGIRPEPGVGTHAHKYDIAGLYDKASGTLDVKVPAGENPNNAFEQALLDAGYTGWLDRDSGVACLLGEREISPEYLGADTGAYANAPQVGPLSQSPAQQISQELRDDKTLPQGELTGPRWADRLQKIYPDVYAKLEAAGYIEPLRTYEQPIPRYAIPFIGEAARVLTQAAPSNKRGGFNPSTLTTILTQQADYSTFLHETAHFFLTTYLELASSPNASPAIQQDVQTLLNWFGVADLETWNAMSLDEQRKHHEAFAYNYEIYLFEGRAPNPKMQTIFERFSAWLKRIYTSITTELNQIYQQEHGEDLPILTGEVKQVMDRMLASDKQIEQAERIRGMAPIFRTQQEAGMNDAEWAAYQELQDEAHNTALATHRAASLRQMKWLSNAKSKTLKALQATTRDLRKTILAEVTDQVNSMPIYKAKDALKNATGIEELAIADAMGYFGYGTITELEAAIKAAPKKADLIRQLTDKRMLEEHGELMDPKALENTVNEAVHNQARARFIGVELRHLSKTVRPVRVMQEAARQAARTILGKKMVKDIRPQDYTAAEARAAAVAENAMKTGDTAAATQAKEYQLLQNQLAAEALNAQAQVAKSLEAFKKIFGPDKSLGKARDMNYVNVARAILAHYGLGTSEQPASFYLTKIKEYDPDFYAEIEDMITAHQAQAKPIHKLTLAEFADLSDQIQALWHLSRRNKQIEIDGQLMDRKAVVKELNEAIRDLNSPAERPGYKRAVSKWQEAKLRLMGMRAAMRRVEAWVDAMDKGAAKGPFRTYIWNPISEAVTRYRKAKEEYLVEYLELIKGIEPLLQGKNIDATEIGYTFTPQELLHAILHTGNSSNKRKLLLGREWGAVDENGQLDSEQWDSFIARAARDGILTKAHYDFAQKVWDLLERMKPAAQKAHREMYGFYFNEITAEPFDTPWGVYAGGYVPAVTDPNIVTDAAMQREKETTLVDNSFMFPSTGRGFTKARVEYNKPLLLNLGYLMSHMDKVLRFTHIEPRIKDAARIVKTNRSFANAMDEFDPTARGDLLVPWLQRTAMQLVATPSKGRGGQAADAIFRYLRTNTGMQIMVGNITNTLQQFTGVSIAALKVKPRLLRNALWQYIRQPKETMEMIQDRSDYMATRISSVQYEVQQTVDELLLNPNKYEQLVDFARKHGYFMQQGTQGIVDTITWLGAYNEAAENGIPEKDAVRQADSAVRMTQGSFAAEDVSRIETGSAFVRAFTHFYSYFNMMANVLGSEFLNVSRGVGCKEGAGRLLYIYSFGYMVPALLSEMIVQAMGGFDTGDDDEFDLWDAMRLFFSSQARPLAAMVPGLGPAVLAGANAWNDKYYDDRMSTSPAVSAIEATVRAPHSVYQAIAEEGSWSRASKDFLTGLGMITRIPLGQLGKPFGYIADVAQGRIEPDSLMDVARGLISGKDVNRKQ